MLTWKNNNQNGWKKKNNQADFFLFLHLYSSLLSCIFTSEYFISIFSITKCNFFYYPFFYNQNINIYKCDRKSIQKDNFLLLQCHTIYIYKLCRLKEFTFKVFFIMAHTLKLWRKHINIVAITYKYFLREKL